MRKHTYFTKKSLYLLALTMLFALVLAACGGNSNKSNNDNGEAEPAEDTGQTFQLKFNSYISPSDFDWEPKMKSQEHFVQYIEEETDGRVEIELFHNNQLAGQVESLDALAKNTFSIQNISPSYWSSKVPEGDFFSLPFWTMSEEHAYHIIRETEVGELYEEALAEYGVKPIMYWPSGITGFNSVKKPITEPDDLKGLVYNNTSDLTGEFYRNFGAGLATVAIAEQYEAFLRGTLDVMVFPYSGLESLSLHEVIEYITLPAVINPAVGMIAMNLEQWNELPADVQEGIQRAVDRLEKEALEGSVKLTERAIDYAEEHGVEVVYMTEDTYNEFLEAAKEQVWGTFANKSERMSKMIDTLNEATDKWLEENPDQLEKFEAVFK